MARIVGDGAFLYYCGSIGGGQRGKELTMVGLSTHAQGLVPFGLGDDFSRQFRYGMLFGLSSAVLATQTRLIDRDARIIGDARAFLMNANFAYDAFADGDVSEINQECLSDYCLLQRAFPSVWCAETGGQDVVVRYNSDDELLGFLSDHHDDFRSFMERTSKLAVAFGAALEGESLDVFSEDVMSFGKVLFKTLGEICRPDFQPFF